MRQSSSACSALSMLLLIGVWMCSSGLQQACEAGQDRLTDQNALQAQSLRYVWVHYLLAATQREISAAAVSAQAGCGTADTSPCLHHIDSQDVGSLEAPASMCCNPVRSMQVLRLADWSVTGSVSLAQGVVCSGGARHCWISSGTNVATSVLCCRVCCKPTVILSTA